MIMAMTMTKTIIAKIIIMIMMKIRKEIGNRIKIQKF